MKTRKCLYCGEETKDDFCSQDHKIKYNNKIDIEIPIIKGNGKLSDHEQNLIDKYLEKRK